MTVPTEPQGPKEPETPAQDPTWSGWMNLEGTVARVPSAQTTPPTRPLRDSPSVRPTVAFHAPAIEGYEVERMLGRGGMGVVYLARHIGLNRRVALKMMLTGAYAGPDELVRFRAETQAVAQLVHPNIVQIYEVGEHKGAPFCALEYVNGGSLGGWLDGKPQPALTAARLMETLATAVQAAHDKGIIHRDLKPDNILLAVDDRKSSADSEQSAPDRRAGNKLLTAIPKISDFGLAKRLDGNSNQTQVGDVVGTPNYMSPEQASARNKDVGPAADIYALGAVLYEMITGRPPFTGVNPTDTLLQVIAGDPVAPRRLQAMIPRDLETICLKCLHRSPEKRYANAAALAEDLRRFRNGEPIQARPTGPLERAWRWCRRKPTAAALAAVALLLLVTLAVGGPLTALRESELRRETEAQERIAINNAVAARSAKEQADQRLVRLHIATGTNALQAREPMTALLWYAHAWATDPNAATNELSHRQRVAAVLEQMPKLEAVCFHSGPVIDAVYDHNFHRLVTRTDAAEAYLWDPLANKLLATLPHAGRVRALAFTPDGAVIATAGDDRTARLWDAATGTPRGAPLAHPSQVHGVAFAPDGATLATGGVDGVIRFWRVADGQALPRTFQAPSECSFVVYSPDGARLLTAHRDGRAVLWDAATGEQLAAKLPHETVTFDPAFENRPSPVFSPDGKRLITAAGNIVYIWDGLTGKPLNKLDVGLRNVKYLTVSADGVLGSAHVGSSAHVFRLDNGQRIHMLNHPRETPIGCFCATPAGLRMVTASSHGLGHCWQFANDFAKFSELPLRFRHAGQITSLHYDPERNRVLAAGSDGTARVWSLDTAAARDQEYDFKCGRADLIRLGPDDARNIQGRSFSPDGLWQIRCGGPGPIVPFRRDGTGTSAAKIAVLEPPRQVIFSPDGKRLLTIGQQAARAWDFATGQPIGPRIAIEGQVTQAWLSDNGRRALVVLDRGSEDNRNAVLAWDIDTGVKRLSLQDPDLSGPPPTAREYRRDLLNRCAISPDGRRVALAGGWFGLLQFFDLDTGQRIAAVGHKGFVASAEFSPDGRRVVSASSDATARLWDAATGQPDAPVLRHNQFVRDAVFAPDGQRVATVLAGGALEVWDAVAGDLLIDQLGPAGAARGPLWFSRDGRRVIAMSPTGAGLRQWALPTLAVPAAYMPSIVHLLTGQRLDETNGVDLLNEDEFRGHRSTYEVAWAAWLKAGKSANP